MLVGNHIPPQFLHQLLFHYAEIPKEQFSQNKDLVKKFEHLLQTIQQQRARPLGILVNRLITSAKRVVAVSADFQNDLEIRAGLVTLDIPRESSDTTKEATLETPLMVAARNGNEVVVHLLLKYGAKPNCCDYRKQTALMHAITSQLNNPCVAILLLNGADASIPRVHLHTPLMAAAEAGDINTIKKLLALPNSNLDLDAVNSDDETALSLAVQRNHLECAEFLLMKGANPDIKNKNDVTLLIESVKHKNLEATKLLLQYGANCDAQDNDKQTALHWVTSKVFFKLLLDAGANPNLSDDRGHTPLMGAAEKSNVAIVQLLLAAGANPNETDKYKLTALHYAVINPACVSALIAAKANPNLDNFDNSPLRKALRDQYYESARILLRAGANLPQEDIIDLRIRCDGLDCAYLSGDKSWSNTNERTALLLSFNIPLKDPERFPRILDKTDNNSAAYFFCLGEAARHGLTGLKHDPARYQAAKKTAAKYYANAIKLPYPAAYRRLGEIAELDEKFEEALDQYLYAIQYDDCLAYTNLVKLFCRLSQKKVENQSSADQKEIVAGGWSLLKFWNTSSETRGDAKQETASFDQTAFVQKNLPLLFELSSKVSFLKLTPEEWAFLATSCITNPPEDKRSACAATASWAIQNLRKDNRAEDFKELFLAVEKFLQSNPVPTNNVDPARIKSSRGVTPYKKPTTQFTATDTKADAKREANPAITPEDEVTTGNGSTEITQPLPSEFFEKLLFLYANLSERFYSSALEQALRELLTTISDQQKMFGSEFNTLMTNAKKDLSPEQIRQLEITANDPTINVTNRMGETPLMVAAQTRNYVMLGLLLEFGASPNLCDSRQMTALAFALDHYFPGDALDTQHGPDQCVSLLIKYGADPNIMNKAGKTPLMLAIKYPKLLAELLETTSYKINFELKTPKGETALILAIENNALESAALLLEAGADPNTKTFGFTPLMIAARASNYRAIELLLKHEANCQAKNLYRQTALHFVKNSDCCWLLLGADADPDMVDDFGWTPLMHAADQGDAKVIKLLLDAGADPYILSPNSPNNVLTRAVTHLDCLQILLAETDVVRLTRWVDPLRNIGSFENTSKLLRAGVHNFISITDQLDIFNGRYPRGHYTNIELSSIVALLLSYDLQPSDPRTFFSRLRDRIDEPKTPGIYHFCRGEEERQLYLAKNPSAVRQTTKQVVIQHYQAATKSTPPYVAAFRRLGELAEMDENFDEAFDYYKQAIDAGDNLACRNIVKLLFKLQSLAHNQTKLTSTTTWLRNLLNPVFSTVNSSAPVPSGISTDAKVDNGLFKKYAPLLFDLSSKEIFLNLTPDEWAFLAEICITDSNANTSVTRAKTAGWAIQQLHKKFIYDITYPENYTLRLKQHLTSVLQGLNILNILHGETSSTPISVVLEISHYNQLDKRIKELCEILADNLSDNSLKSLSSIVSKNEKALTKRELMFALTNASHEVKLKFYAEAQKMLASLFFSPKSEPLRTFLQNELTKSPKDNEGRDSKHDFTQEKLTAELLKHPALEIIQILERSLQCLPDELEKYQAIITRVSAFKDSVRTVTETALPLTYPPVVSVSRNPTITSIPDSKADARRPEVPKSDSADAKTDDALKDVTVIDIPAVVQIPGQLNIVVVKSPSPSG